MKTRRVIVLTSSRADFTGNDVNDDVIITKINRVFPYPLRKNPVKFHHDRIRFTWVMLLTRKCRQTDDDDIMMTTPLVLPRGKNTANRKINYEFVIRMTNLNQNLKTYSTFTGIPSRISCRCRSFLSFRLFIVLRLWKCLFSASEIQIAKYHFSKNTTFALTSHSSSLTLLFVWENSQMLFFRNHVYINIYI